MELARQGATVVVVDPGVSVEGEALNEPTASETASRIRADGGRAISSTVSVTDGPGLAELFEQVSADLGPVSIVVNTAGILRFPRLADAVEDDWAAVVGVHLGGYVTVLSAALPIMESAGYGRVVGFTSGVGLARTSAGMLAYGTAKRAVAALTWELGPRLPRGVAVNALSPIAATRMVRRTLEGPASGADGAPGPRGLDLSAMPQPEHMAPAAAYLAGDRSSWCRGQVIFSAGSELTVIERPRLLEAVRTADVDDFARALDTVVPTVLVPAESDQRTGGGSNPRFGDVFLQTGARGVAPSGPTGSGPTASCLVISDDDRLASEVQRAVQAWGLFPIGLKLGRGPAPAAGGATSAFEAASVGLLEAARTGPPLGAVVIAKLGPLTEEADPWSEPSWRETLSSHAGVVGEIVAHAAWLRAATRYAESEGRGLRVAHVTGALSAAGKTTAQAVAQMVRSANDTPSPVPVEAFSLSLESGAAEDLWSAAQLLARLVAADDVRPLQGAELAAGRGWVALRSHPGPSATVSFGGPAIPRWVDGVLAPAVR
jgi:NAD(P)-dependent dehydrogenase (short-subunit alcohol dehydrogenase family)